MSGILMNYFKRKKRMPKAPKIGLAFVGEVIFRYKFYDGVESACNYSDFLQFLKKEKNYWKKVDNQVLSEKGYSATYTELIDNLEQVVHCEDESVLQTPQTTIEYAFSLINTNTPRLQINNVSFWG